jgi:ESCRT-I complex subunit TSG101
MWQVCCQTIQHSLREQTYSVRALAAVRMLTYKAFENGSSNLFLLLSGTVPVLFRGVTYNFPIACWVLYGYPREAPLVFVKPGPDMMIRMSQHVANDGRIYHPYLSQWSRYWDVSTPLS